MRTIAIIPCTNQKTVGGGKARDVWKGGHFQLTLAHAERYYTEVLVMSYKYGLISPELEIEPYDINIQYAPAAVRVKWWWLVKEHIKALSLSRPDLIALYTGMYDHQRIVREFVLNEFDQVITPWEGLKIGERMQMVYDDVSPFDPNNIGSYTVTLDTTTRLQRSAFDASEVEWID